MKPKRTTVYLEPDLHKALKVKAAETDQAVSELVNDVERRRLLEDAKTWPFSSSERGSLPRRSKLSSET